MRSLPDNLQDAFVSGHGAPIRFGDEEIVGGDRWEIDEPAIMELRFIGVASEKGQAVRISAKKPGAVQLSDGQSVRVLEVRDEPELPRFVRHPIYPKGGPILICNNYLVERGGHHFRECWTGNAGMIVTKRSATARLYECSSGNGQFDRNNLRFEITFLPADSLWMPKDIYE